MTAIDEFRRIAEEEIGCQFFEGTLNELNQDIENNLISKEKWVFGYVSPPTLTDKLTNGVIETTLPFTAYIVKQYVNDSSEYRTKTIKPIIRQAQKKARKFLEKMNESDLIQTPTDGAEYPRIYGQFDLHLFGVGIDCEFVISEGLTGCEDEYEE